MTKLLSRPPTPQPWGETVLRLPQDWGPGDTPPGLGVWGRLSSHSLPKPNAPHLTGGLAIRKDLSYHLSAFKIGRSGTL